MYNYASELRADELGIKATLFCYCIKLKQKLHAANLDFFFFFFWKKLIVATFHCARTFQGLHSTVQLWTSNNF
jgi:hypothetical protein